MRARASKNAREGVKECARRRQMQRLSPDRNPPPFSGIDGGARRLSAAEMIKRYFCSARKGEARVSAHQ